MLWCWRIGSPALSFGFAVLVDLVDGTFHRFLTHLLVQLRLPNFGPNLTRIEDYLCLSQTYENKLQVRLILTHLVWKLTICSL